MTKRMHSVLSVIVLLACGLIPMTAAAGPITYTETFNATGTVNGNPFDGTAIFQFEFSRRHFSRAELRTARVRALFSVDCDVVTHYRNERGWGMTVDLNPEQEQLIQQAIRAGVISATEEVVTIGIETIRQRLESRRASQTPFHAEPWSHEFHAWVHSHSTATPLLSDEASSREFIYGTRGL